MADQLVDECSAAPAPELAGLVGGYHGSRLAGFPPGKHLGLPSPHLEVIVALGEPIELAAMPNRAQPPGSFVALAAGLLTGPAVIAHDGSAYTVSLPLTPAGARSLFGMPASAVAGAVVGLDDLLGPAAGELVEQLAAAPDWPSRFTVLDRVLTRRTAIPTVAIDPALAYAWRRIVATGGAIRIGDLAAEVGYSRQHLARRFAGEFGLTPKQVARITRFTRSRQLLQRTEQQRRQCPGARHPTLAEVAAGCGYHDQAHLAQEWNDLAGCPPSTWLGAEELPFAQAEPVARVPG